MPILEKIRNRTKIDVDLLKKRLIKELNVDETKEGSIEQVEYSLFDTMILILDKIQQPKIPEGLYTTWIRMTKDYWDLNGYNKIYTKANTEETNASSQAKIKSLKIGDTTTTFIDPSSQVEINGITYNAGTVDYSEDALIEKYKKELCKHRKMRW